MNRWHLVVCGMALLFMAGCQNDEIRSYDVPKPEVVQQDSPASAKTPVRLLVAILPNGDRTWFFKLSGPTEELDQHKGAFDRFISSIRFADQGNPPITWTVPDSWKQEPGSALRYATFHLGPRDASPELTVFAFGRDAGSMLANVNRWRGQIGLGAVTEAELGEVSHEMKVNGVAGTLVDMTGQSAGATRKTPPFASIRPPFAGGAPAETASHPALKYNKPEGWKELPATGEMRVAAFRVIEGDSSAEVTIIPLGGAAGGLLLNVNRWREQINLDPISEEQLRKDSQPTEVDGKPAQYVDLIGPDSGGGERQRILAVTTERGEQTWFFKMKGPADLVGKQKSAFEAFVRSVRF